MLICLTGINKNVDNVESNYKFRRKKEKKKKIEYRNVILVLSIKKFSIEFPFRIF